MPHRRLLALLAGLSVLAAGCGGGRASSAPTTPAPATSTSTTTTTLPTTTTTTIPATTTTTLPPEPQPSPLLAASTFIDGWESGDRARSANVAVPAAVAALFANSYAGQTVISRGCSDQFHPIVCSFGPYGGGTGALYEVDLLPAGPNWYVSDVQILK